MDAVPVTCAIIMKDGKFLAAQRGATMSQALRWEFPGGKLEAGERERDCVIREVREELGIDIKPIVRLSPNTHRYPDVKIKLIPFLAQYSSGELVLREHADARWFTLEELDRLNWAQADLPIVDELMGFEF